MLLQVWLLLAVLAVVIGGCWLHAARERSRAYRKMTERHEHWRAKSDEFWSNYMKAFEEKA